MAFSPDAPDCTLVIPRRSSPLVLPLHTRHLAASSGFLRGLFAGLAPADLVQSLSHSRRPLRIPRSRLPRLLPSPSSHPVLFLPVPDPSSIQPLFRWVYSGNTDHLQHALDHGDIQWHGLACNVEYLGLPTDIKVFLGRWYRDRRLPAPCLPRRTPHPSDEPLDDSDESDLDSECDRCYSPSTPSTDDEMQCEGESVRGRSRHVKPLVQWCGQLRPCTT